MPLLPLADIVAGEDRGVGAAARRGADSRSAPQRAGGARMQDKVCRSTRLAHPDFCYPPVSCGVRQVAGRAPTLVEATRVLALRGWRPVGRTSFGNGPGHRGFTCADVPQHPSGDHPRSGAFSGTGSGTRRRMSTARSEDHDRTAAMGARRLAAGRTAAMRGPVPARRGARPPRANAARSTPQVPDDEVAGATLAPERKGRPLSDSTTSARPSRWPGGPCAREAGRHPQVGRCTVARDPQMRSMGGRGGTCVAEGICAGQAGAVVDWDVAIEP